MGKVTSYEYVAILKDSNYLEYEKVKRVFRKKYNGLIYKIDSRFVALETTREHYLYCFKSRVLGQKKRFGLVKV